jgi:hypothetical protein
MIVTVNYTIEPGPALRSRGRKFGETKLDEINSTRIDAQCSPVERGSRTCQCRLTRVHLDITCIVRLNPQKIARSFFDPDPNNPRGYEGRLVNGQYVPESPDHFPLDEESILIHERSHCLDIADAIQAHVKQQLEQVESSLIAQCPCDRQDLCHSALMNMVVARIRALGARAYEELLRDAREHKRQSATEREARQAQIDDFNQREADSDGE